VGYGKGCGAVEVGRNFWNGLGFQYLPLLLLKMYILGYTVCPGSVRTVFVENTRRELFSKFHSFYSK
jgi:hypothetical protein